jgi:EAL domain-containing protein (putative c-di-GMP-specific phosphodiesterase class I)/GGDEF domain-containing protein
VGQQQHAEFDLRTGVDRLVGAERISIASQNGGSRRCRDPPELRERTWIRVFALQQCSYRVVPSSDFNSEATHDLPDLIITLSRDGRILSRLGGHGLPGVLTSQIVEGTPVESAWSPEFAGLLRRLVRKATASRSVCEAQHQEGGHPLQIRVTPQGPERAFCVVRLDPPLSAQSAAHDGAGQQQPFLDRRGLLARFEETLSRCMLVEKPATVIVLELDGAEQVAQLDAKTSEQAVAMAIMRVCADPAMQQFTSLAPIFGQWRDSQIAILLETSNRPEMERFTLEFKAIVARPALIDDAAYSLTPYGGAAILGRDGSAAKTLLDHACIGALEARRGGEQRMRFFSDTIKMTSLARLDVVRELRDAIARDEIGMRYVGRCHIDSGRLAVLVGYARWSHRLRGRVAPRKFIGLAEGTGAAIMLSRALLRAAQRDFPVLSARIDPDVRISVGPLRHHLLHEEFLADIEQFLEDGPIRAAQLEIRLSELTLIALPQHVCVRLYSLGIQLVIDEVGRGLSFLDKLARSPIWGMQLDRNHALGVADDVVIQRMCRAQVAAARALGLSPIACGVDDEALRRRFQEIGCSHGSGELYARTVPNMDQSAEDITRECETGPQLRRS